MEKVKITWIKREEKVSQRTNKPFTSLSIKTDKHGERYLSSFGSKDNADWNVGDEVEISVTEKVSGGKSYLNFETPKKSVLEVSSVNHKLESILIKLGKIEYKLGIMPMTPSNAEEADKGYKYPTPEEDASYTKAKAESEIKYPDEEINVEEIPF